MKGFLKKIGGYGLSGFSVVIGKHDHISPASFQNKLSAKCRGVGESLFSGSNNLAGNRKSGQKSLFSTPGNAL
jgi:hypothetical protein